MAAPATPAVCNTFVGLKQTVCWDMRSQFPRRGRIPVPEWMEFLEKDAGVDLKNITDALQHSITGYLLIQVPDEGVYKSILRKAEDGVVWSKYDVRVYGWSAGEETTKVHLHNVLQESDLNAAIEEMSKHGTIINKEVHHYKQARHIRNGIVTLTMRVKAGAEMPGFIYEEEAGNTIEVYSDKHERACWRCLGKGHIAAFCKKPVKTQETASRTTTWAKIVAGTPPAPSTQEAEAQEPENPTSSPTAEELNPPTEKQMAAPEPKTPVETKSKEARPRVTPYKPEMERRMSTTRDHSGQRGEKRVGIEAHPEEILEKRNRTREALQNV